MYCVYCGVGYEIEEDEDGDINAACPICGREGE